MRFWSALFLLAAALNIVLGFHNWPVVFGGSLNDPDSYMRLLRIRQGIAQGHLVDVVARDDSGAGVMVEWSRLLDILLWLMAAPLSLFVGWTPALFVAGIVLGPLGVGVLGVSLAFAAQPFAEDRFLWAAAVAAALLPGLLTFALPGVVHYHILLLALIALTVGCVARAWRGFVGFGFLAGLCGGFAIWLTPETMPFVLMAYAALLIGWLNRPIGAAVAACGAGLFDVLGFGFALDPPAGGYAMAEADRLSVDYVVLGLFMLLGGVALWRLEKWRAARWHWLSGVAIMSGLLLSWIALFPKVALGPYGIMDPEDMRRFFGVMRETRPLSGTDQELQFLLPGLLAFCYAVWRAISARGAGMAVWLWSYTALCTLVALVLAERFLLFVEFPAGIAAALTPVALSEVSRTFRARPAAAMLARLAVMVTIFVLPQLPALAARPAKPEEAKSFPSCSLRHIGALLSPYAGEIVLAEAQDTPELLYRSSIDTVGSLYQHGLAGYLRARAAWRSSAGIAEPAAVSATGAKLVLFCRRPDRYALVRDLPETTLWDTLQAGHPPSWLTPLGADPKTGWRIYAIHG